ncbi:hypothetical protein [Alkalicoccus luteus]|uniref:Uncharacterized protein n=1 Tax=Alkalicoccus luteus TaxID=1237094 RepID=A0A969PQF3_9BACI|nr:hypothetical protein [Alkalicoccus luteus]NJP37094.1 hypothetical protein [Alkalicoccus luteus]
MTYKIVSFFIIFGTAGLMLYGHTANSHFISHLTENHSHRAVEAEEPVPELIIRLEETEGGYLLHEETEHFRFTRDEAVTPGGHGHLYVNGEREARVYAFPYALGELDPGTEITLVLADHEHRILTTGGYDISSNATIK